jgi:hypothetical protein
MLAEEDSLHNASKLFLGWEFNEASVVCPFAGATWDHWGNEYAV